MPTAPEHQKRALSPSRWWGFVPFAVLSAIHVGARAAGADDLAGPTKLALMPLLAVAAVWALRSAGTSEQQQTGEPSAETARPAEAARPALLPAALLFGALLFSWLGDGAATFVPFAPELPVMLGSFGIAHLCYIWLMARYAAGRRFPRWALVYPLWWVLMLVVLWPVLGSLSLAVAAYGIVLAGTAATASRCGPVVAAGGVLFLASDTILSFRIFMPDAMPGWTSAMVMLTYCAGQGLIVAGVLHRLRPGRAATLPGGSAADLSTRP
ncbi:lysoplasmalogenase [Arthrobacter sp. zg-Y40]|uniref:lysoplasmalogenase family protein n=1 Tax=Arthrobacter sp. zg-Y40 TaxID=2886939 RepID=UPI001D14FEF7|nr:lysoplasmalogenase [Arthrobacter sp. zg-Y40]